MAGLLGGLVIGLSQSSDATRDAGLWIGGSMIFWMPAYMIVLVAPWLYLRQMGDAVVRREPVLLRFGPLIALLAAVVGGAALVHT